MAECLPEECVICNKNNPDKCRNCHVKDVEETYVSEPILMKPRRSDKCFSHEPDPDSEAYAHHGN